MPPNPIDELQLEWRDYRRGLHNRGEQEAFDEMFERARPHLEYLISLGGDVDMTDVFVILAQAQERELQRLRSARSSEAWRAPGPTSGEAG